MNLHRIAVDLAEDILEVAGVEPDLERIGPVFGGQFLGRGAVVGAGHGEGHAVLVEPHLDRPGLLRGDGGHTVHALKEALRIELEQLVVASGNDARIIGKGAVDQLAGQYHPAFTAEGEADLAGGQVDLDCAIQRFVEQLAQFRHRLARDDDVRHPFGPVGARQGEAGEPVPVGRRRLEDRLILVRDVEEDAVEVIARFLGRDGEPGAVDQFGDGARGQFETRRQIALDDHREIVARQGRQREAAAPGLYRHPVFGRLEADLAAIGQLAGDVEQEMRRDRDRARVLDACGVHMLDHLEIEIGRHDLEGVVAIGLDQDVGEDGDGIAPLHHRLHVTEAAKQGRAFDGGLHCIGSSPMGAKGPESPLQRRNIAGDLSGRRAPRKAGAMHTAIPWG